MRRKFQSGQALVLVLLSLSVVLTLVLFILSRSITDISVSSNQGDSIRAFSAAEAGVEQALVVGSSSSPNNPIGDAGAKYTATVTNFAEGLTEFVYPFLLSSGDSGTVWFLGHDTNGNRTSAGAFTGNQMKICWGTGVASAASPAIEVSIYYETTPNDPTTILIARAAVDPFSGRNPANNFSAPTILGCTIAGKTYTFQKTFTFSGLGSDFSPAVNTAGLMLARVRMFYNASPQDFGVTTAGSGILPSQAKEIDSSGVAGGSNRRIVVYQSWADFPFAMNTIVSPGGITK